MHDLRRNYILFLNKHGTTSYGLSFLFSYVSAKLRNALPDFIRTYEFTGFKSELCNLKDKHPELMNVIRTLQRDLQELEQKHAKAKSDCDVFNASQ